MKDIPKLGGKNILYSTPSKKNMLNESMDKEAHKTEIIDKISTLSHNELMDRSLVGRILGYLAEGSLDDVEVSTKGYRLLSKIPKTPMNIIENMLKSFGNFQHIIRATTEELDDVDGIGEVRAKNIKQGIKRMHEQAIYDSKFNNIF